MVRVVVVALPDRCFLLVITLYLRHRIISLPFIWLARGIFVEIVVCHRRGFGVIEWDAADEAAWGDLHRLMHSRKLLCLTTTIENAVTILFH